jgi:hypothetical protein
MIKEKMKWGIQKSRDYICRRKKIYIIIIKKITNAIKLINLEY